MQMDSISSPMLPQAPAAFKPSPGTEKGRTTSTAGHTTQVTQSSPKAARQVKPCAFHARPQQAIQPRSRLPTLSFPSGEETPESKSFSANP